MDATLYVTVRDALRQLTRGKTDLLVFREWFGPILWSIEESGSPAAIKLAYDIIGLLSEYDYGHWSLDELITRLAPLADTDVAGIELQPILNSATSSSRQIRAQLTFPAPERIPLSATVHTGLAAVS